MVLLHVYITEDVVVHHSVFAGSEVPRLLLGVIRTILESLELIVEVQDVVSLFHSHCLVLVFGKGFDGVVSFELPHVLFSLRVGECLSNWIILNLL